MSDRDNIRLPSTNYMYPIEIPTRALDDAYFNNTLRITPEAYIYAHIEPEQWQELTARLERIESAVHKLLERTAE